MSYHVLHGDAEALRRILYYVAALTDHSAESRAYLDEMRRQLWFALAWYLGKDRRRPNFFP